MKRLFSVLTSLFILMILNITIIASVTPQKGYDSADYSPPAGYIHYEIPNSHEKGIHSVTFDVNGKVNHKGPLFFTATIGSVPGSNHTQVLSWSSNFPIYSVIVKGGKAFNLYQYDSNVMGDMYLVPPDAPCGKPVDVCHICIVFNPKGISCTPAPFPTPACPPSSAHCFCSIAIVFIIIAFFLLGFILGILRSSQRCMKDKRDHYFLL